MWFSGFLKEKLSFCKYIPVVNFLYYMIDDTPKKDDVETLLNTFGLISALMLTLSPLIISTVSSAELLAADGNYLGFGWAGDYNQPTTNVQIGKYGCLPVTSTQLAQGFDQISVWLIGRVFISMTCVMLSLMNSIILLVSISTLPQLRDSVISTAATETDPIALLPIEGSQSVDQSEPPSAANDPTPAPKQDMKRRQGGLHKETERAFEEAFPAWWSLAWAPVAFIVLPFLIYGVFTFTQSVFALALIRVPNDYRERVCHDNGWVFSHTDPSRGTAVFVNGSFPDPHAFTYTDCKKNIDCIFYALITVLLPLAIMGVAATNGYASYLFEKRLNECGQRIHNEEKEAANQKRVQFGFEKA